MITEEGSISRLQCFFPTIISLQFWISGSECTFRCCREVHSNVILTRFSPHDRLPEQQLLREGQSGSALDWAIRDKGDGPMVWAVWWIRLVTQRAPCRDRRGQQALKTYNDSYNAISSLPMCFSSATAKGCFYHIQLVHLPAFTHKNMDHIVTVRWALTCKFLSNCNQMCGSLPTFLMVNLWPRLQTIPTGASSNWTEPTLHQSYCKMDDSLPSAGGNADDGRASEFHSDRKWNELYR